MTTIYDEAKRRLESEISALEKKLTVSRGLPQEEVLETQRRNYVEMLGKLNADMKSTSPEDAEYQALLRVRYRKGDSGDESLVYCLAVPTYV